jgi:hypothetical protein
MAEQRRKLERLEREMQKAAEELRKQMEKMSPEAQEALRKMAQQMGQMENEIKKLGNGQRTRMQIAQLKEVFRRAGQQGNNGQQPQDGEGQGTNLARNGQPKDGQNGQGKNGKNGKSGTMLKDFNDRAKGGDQNDQVMVLGEDSGNGPQVILPLPMGPGDKPGQGGNGQEMPNQRGEGGIGDQHDPNMMGDKTKLASKRNESRVDGKKGAGPSKSETILGSAERGFASSDYKKVYADYSSVVEEVLSKERIPPGYRYYVKRYFQLIRPRE